MEPYDDERMFKVTERGVLSFCFSMYDGLPVPKRRFARILWSPITPAFFKKVVEVQP
jgi:hypothetical protein